VFYVIVKLTTITPQIVGIFDEAYLWGICP